MTLEKAIELNQKDLDNPGSVPIEDLNQAQALGIEALKRLKAKRELGIHYDQTPLPGETKE